MEPVKIIFENFGGREMERIFRNCLLISLLIKQLVFSLFSVPTDDYDTNSVPAEKTSDCKHILAADTPEEGLDGVQTFKLLGTLALFKTKSPAPSGEVIPSN